MQESMYDDDLGTDYSGTIDIVKDSSKKREQLRKSSKTPKPKSKVNYKGKENPGFLIKSCSHDKFSTP